MFGVFVGGCAAIVGIRPVEVDATEAPDASAPEGDASNGVDAASEDVPPVDAGCTSKSTTSRRGAAAASETSGDKSWSQPENALVSDGAGAQYGFLQLMETSPLLTVRSFGFDVPLGARITGVTVHIDRTANQTVVKDASIVLLSDGPIGDNRKRPDTWTRPTTSDYGGPSDGWNADLTPALVNSPSFGVGVAAVFDLSAGFVSPPPRADVDGITMVVTYCE